MERYVSEHSTDESIRYAFVLLACFPCLGIDFVQEIQNDCLKIFRGETYYGLSKLTIQTLCFHYGSYLQSMAVDLEEASGIDDIHVHLTL